MAHAGSLRLKNAISCQGKKLFCPLPGLPTDMRNVKQLLLHSLHDTMREGVKQHVTGSPSHSMS